MRPEDNRSIAGPREARIGDSLVRGPALGRVALVLTCACGAAHAPQTRDEVAIRCGALLDGVADHPIAHATIAVQGGRIAQVLPRVVASDAPVIDLS